MKDVMFVKLKRTNEGKLQICNYCIASLDTHFIIKFTASYCNIRSMRAELDNEDLGFVVVNAYEDTVYKALLKHDRVKSKETKVINFLDFLGIHNLKGFDVDEFLATGNCIEKKYQYDSDYQHTSKDYAQFCMWYYSKKLYGEDIVEDIIERVLTCISYGLRDSENCLTDDGTKIRLFNNLIPLMEFLPSLKDVSDIFNGLENVVKNRVLFIIYLKNYLIEKYHKPILFKRFAYPIVGLTDSDIERFNESFKINLYRDSRDFEEDVYTKDYLSNTYPEFKAKQRKSYYKSCYYGKKDSSTL